jgi:hypothetical protein
MTDVLSFDAMRDHVLDDPAFEGACKRLQRGGSQEAIAMAVLTAVGFPDLYVDALRYRHMRASADCGGDQFDQMIDASMALPLEGGAA